MLFMYFAAAWYLISIIAALWAYSDARNRGSSGPVWFIIVLLLGLLGLAVWFVVRPSLLHLPPPQR
jgi:sterol desaturase/sphingolipid hydroxylase (fatty acid hydroxylase superfamily)